MFDNGTLIETKTAQSFATPLHHERALAHLTEELLVAEFDEAGAQEADQAVFAAYEGLVPGTVEHDAVEAALARNLVPGTTPFREFVAWSITLMANLPN